MQLLRSERGRWQRKRKRPHLTRACSSPTWMVAERFPTTARAKLSSLQGGAADAVFYIQRGKVKIVVTSEQGKEAVVAILGTGEFLGEGCLVAQPLRLATAKAMAESAVMRIEKAEMVRVLHEQPTFAELFMSHLSTRNSRVEEDLVDQLFNSSEKRLARTLLLLANFGKDGKPEPIMNENQSRDARRNGRHDPASREFLHEQVPKAGFHQLQRRPGSP